MAALKQPIVILYHYFFSPYAHKISYYLALRPNISYQQVAQPPMLPRPDLNSLGCTYRRIPVLAIGNTLFAETDHQLNALEAHFPNSPLAHAEAETWGAFSAGIFGAAAACIPAGLPLMKDPRFVRDRQDYNGRVVSKEDMIQLRASSLKKLEKAFGVTEEALKDGREWISGTKDATLSDIQAVWVIDWIKNLPGGLEGSPISAQAFPKTYAWAERFMKRIGKLPQDNKIKGEVAKEIILNAPKITGGAQGGLVEVVPVDTGRNHPQRGTVVMKTETEILLKVDSEGGRIGMSFPIKGYEVKVIDGAKL